MMDEQKSIAVLDFEQNKAGKLIGGRWGNFVGEMVSNKHEKLLSRRHAENLSMYTSQEEQTLLAEVAEANDFPVIIVPVGAKELGNFGYLVVPEDPELRKRIAADADIHFIDFDDTQGQTSIKKKECWDAISQLGIPLEVVKFSDRIARFTFREDQGEIYEPELDMRLLTHILECKDMEPDQLKSEMQTYLNHLLTYPGTFCELQKEFSVDARIQEIFTQTRFNVALYPDTEEVLGLMRKSPSDRYPVNLFCLTYGDSVFQFEKTIGLLKTGSVQAIFLTKAKKGPFLERVIEENPFVDLDLTQLGGYRDNFRRSSGFDYRGIRLKNDRQLVVVTDDDPGQIVTVDAIAKKYNLPMEARRIVSPDQKRSDKPTPLGEEVLVIEISRDENLRIREDLAESQTELFIDIALNELAKSVMIWLEKQPFRQGGLMQSSYTADQIISQFFGDMRVDKKRDNAVGMPNHWVDSFDYSTWHPKEIQDAAWRYKDLEKARGVEIDGEQSVAAVKLKFLIKMKQKLGEYYAKKINEN